MSAVVRKRPADGPPDPLPVTEIPKAPRGPKPKLKTKGAGKGVFSDVAGCKHDKSKCHFIHACGR